jgi:hypothetical protein
MVHQPAEEEYLKPQYQQCGKKVADTGYYSGHT